MRILSELFFAWSTIGAIMETSGGKTRSGDLHHLVALVEQHKYDMRR
jgi:hypothetical protein